jgi:predicted alpha/beta-fold hydrolase
MAVTHGRIVASAFAPHPLLRAPHLQTLATLLRPRPAVEFERERVELADGDFVELGWCGPQDAPIVLLLHGLTGDFDSKYLCGTARELAARGLRCAAFLMRGAGAEPNRLPRCYHHGASDDLREVIDGLAARFPATPLAAVGWSLGGNVLLKYLGESGAATPLRAAAAACAPFHLEACAERLRRGFSRVYQQHLLANLKGMIRRKFARIATPIDLAPAYAARDFFEFDDAATAPLNGFVDARDYYARSSCGQFLRRIARPTLIVHAVDDPFMTPALVPPVEALASDVTLELSPHGGHVGFIAAGTLGRPQYWLEPHLADHLAARLRGG